MSAPVSSQVPRQAPAIWNSKRHGTDWQPCQLWYGNRDDNETGWGQDIVCPNIHVRSDPSSGWILRNWGFVTTVENATREPIRSWVVEKSRLRQSILPWMLSWDLFQDCIKEARGGSFPDDLVLRLPWVEAPLKASTEFEWRMSMAAAEFFLASDHRMWCGQQTRTIVVCRSKEFRTLVDQGWTALMRELKEGGAGHANGDAQSKDAGSDSTTDLNLAEGRGLLVKDETSSTDNVADTTVGDGGGDAATETTTTTTTTINNSTTTTTTTTINNSTTATTTTVVSTVAGGGTTANTTTTTTSTKRKNKTQAKSQDGGNNKRPRGSTTGAEQNTVIIDLE